MSIARIAPERYEHQDLACIELALRLRHAGAESLVVEPPGGEDAELTIGGPDRRRLEIQVND